MATAWMWLQGAGDLILDSYTTSLLHRGTHRHSVDSIQHRVSWQKALVLPQVRPIRSFSTTVNDNGGNDDQTH